MDAEGEEWGKEGNTKKVEQKQNKEWDTQKRKRRDVHKSTVKLALKIPAKKQSKGR